nr:retrovirus-related Pol polyprotein from transposon TNT 1-94 [Tanacetum cinerariifolium]
NAVCATCNKCLVDSNHFACVMKMLNDMNARTKNPNVVPISTRKPKSHANKSVATPHKKKVVSKSTNQKPQSYYRMLYEKTSKTLRWWIEQQSPSGYKWVPKAKMQWVPKAKNEKVLNSRTSNVNAACNTCGKCLVDSNHFACVTKMLNDVNARTKKHKLVPISTRKPKGHANKYVATPHKKKVASKSNNQKPQSYFRMLYEQTSNLKMLCNFIEKFMGTVRFGNDQFVPILGYEDLVQGNIMINGVYYVEGLNHNLFSVGKFCDADLEVAFRKSTCFVRDLQGNDLLVGNRRSDLYTIYLQESTSITQLCLMAKATPTQAWLWH